jgi:hypothetical protein
MLFLKQQMHPQKVDFMHPPFFLGYLLKIGLIPSRLSNMI